MTLYKRGNVWWVEFVKDGVRHRRSCNTTKKAEAVVWLKSIETARKMPTFEDAVEVLRMLYSRPAEGILSVDSAWSSYIRVARATGKDAIEPRTMERRKNRVDRFVEWLKAETPVRTAEGVNGPIAAKYAECLALQGLKTKTRKNILGDLSTVWKLLEKVSTNVRNPWGSLAPRDTDGKVGKPFTEKDEELVMAAAKEIGKDWWQVCTIMRHTGLRYSSVSRLTWKEIHGDVIEHEPIKTRRHHIKVAIPIIKPVQEAIDSLPRNGDYLFPLHAELYGKRGQSSRLLVFADVLNKAGIGDKGYTIHSWRHTEATRLGATGASKETRKQILGHTTDVMAELYDHDEHLAEKRKALEAAAGITDPSSR